MFEAKDFQYEYALVCRNLPTSLVNGLSLEEHEPVELAKAADEHNQYLQNLIESGIKLIEIQAQEVLALKSCKQDFPDCVFVEDTAIALDHKILITNPGAKSRRGETKAVEAAFEQHSRALALEIHQIKNKEEAFVDGGDVCFTGREILVGLSKRTNLKGAEAIAEVFQPIPVQTCDVVDGLHLKSIMSMLLPDVFLIGTSSAAQQIRKQIEEKSPFANHYRFVEIDEDQSGSANVLAYNGRVIYSSSFEHLYKEMDDFKGMTRALPNKEFKKIDGCLTCRCVFFNKKN